MQTALRPAHDLDALDVQQIHIGAHVAPQVNAVDVDADRRIGGDDVILQADAAHEDRRVAGIALAEVGLHQVRREFFDLIEFGEATYADVFFRQRGDSGGYVYQRFLPTPRGDDDFLHQRGGFGSGGGRLAERRPPDRTASKNASGKRQPAAGKCSGRHGNSENRAPLLNRSTSLNRSAFTNQGAFA